jgi:hypothetical protein
MRFSVARSVVGVSLVLAMGARAQSLVSPNPEQWSDFGECVAAVPDVNGDGRGEMAVGGPGENHGGLVNAGRAYLFNSNGTRRLTLISPAPQSGGGFGKRVAGIPDTSGDGFGDLGITEGAQVHVFSGSNGLRRITMKLPFVAEEIAGLKDVTGDGRGDLAVGAPGYRPDGSFLPVGRVYIYNCVNGTPVRHLDSPSNQAANSDFASSLAGIPDVNGDGRPELAVGAPGEAGTGRVYLFSPAGGLLLRTLVSPHSQSDGQFGASVSGVPDVNGDGCGDILIGAPHEIVGNNPDWAGRAYLYSGKTGVLLRQFGAGSPAWHDQFGCSVAGASDLNGDGRGDIIIGCRGRNEQAGRVFVYSGATGVFLRGYASPNQEEFGAFGVCVAGLGDINGDGKGDIGVGAQFESVAPVDGAGRAYMFQN